MCVIFDDSGNVNGIVANLASNPGRGKVMSTAGSSPKQQHVLYYNWQYPIHGIYANDTMRGGGG